MNLEKRIGLGFIVAGLVGAGASVFKFRDSLQEIAASQREINYLEANYSYKSFNRLNGTTWSSIDMYDSIEEAAFYSALCLVSLVPIGIGTTILYSGRRR